jgi:glycosyltransferase involved in cell wall biosynthesis
MRILHLIATLDPRAGGPANSVRRIVATYPQIDGHGEVLTLDPPTAPFLHNLPFTIHTLGPVANTFGYTPLLIPWLRAHRHRFDGVVVHGLWQFHGLAVLRAAADHLPFIVFPHGMLDPYFKRARPLKHIKKTLYWWLSERRLLHSAHAVLFTSAAESQLATRSFWPPTRWNARIVPYGASPCPADPARLRQAFLERHPALRAPHSAPGHARPFLLFLSRIHPKKGCDLLLEAFIRIAPQAPDLHLVLAGPDSHDIASGLARRAAHAGLTHRVHLPGMLEGDQKWGAFSACQAFSLPSHQENFGIAVAEALACGKPVLLSDQVNIWQEIVADGAGFAAPDTAAGTLHTLTQWIGLSHGERATMEERALACFQRRYDMRANALELVTLLAELTTPPPTADQASVSPSISANQLQ